MTENARRIELAREWDALRPDQRHALLLTWTPFQHPRFKDTVESIQARRFDLLNRSEQRGVLGLLGKQARDLEARASTMADNTKRRNTMKNTTTEIPKDTTPKTPKAKKEAGTPAVAAKVEKTPAPAKPEPEADAEPVDRLPATVEELKESKSGFVTFLFLSGKDKDQIAKELQTAFKLAEGQAVKIVRRITGRARFFQRAFALVPAK